MVGTTIWIMRLINVRARNAGPNLCSRLQIVSAFKPRVIAVLCLLDKFASNDLLDLFIHIPCTRLVEHKTK